MSVPEPAAPHLSFSRLRRWETCPLSYRLHYVDKREAEAGVPLRFGTMIHAVLERLVREAVESEVVGVLSGQRALELYREAWTAEGLAGVGLFEEGLRLLDDFVHQQGVVDHRDVLGVEKEFRLRVGPFTVLGYIDRVDAKDDETIEVIDYKTNHQLFTREEVDTSLQLSLYAAAALRLWPWAKDVKLAFWMLRHGVRQEATRTPEQIAHALAYVETLGLQIESAQEFPARLNPNCVHCDHRRDCSTYAEALRGPHDLLCEDPSDLEAVATERERVARLAKILYARKDELERVLKVHLADKDELVLAGMRYRLYRTTSLDYPLAPTVRLLAEATDLTQDELIEKLARVDKKALDALLKDLGKRTERARVTLLKAALDAHADTQHSPRLWAKELAS